MLTDFVDGSEDSLWYLVAAEAKGKAASSWFWSGRNFGP